MCSKWQSRCFINNVINNIFLFTHLFFMLHWLQEFVIKYIFLSTGSQYRYVTKTQFRLRFGCDIIARYSSETTYLNIWNASYNPTQLAQCHFTSSLAKEIFRVQQLVRQRCHLKNVISNFSCAEFAEWRLRHPSYQFAFVYHIIKNSGFERASETGFTYSQIVIECLLRV